MRWTAVPDPTAQRGPTRTQVPGATVFAGGEGIWYWRGVCYFTTKGDKKVWAYDTRKNLIDVLFDRRLAQDSSLDAVDNVTISPARRRAGVRGRRQHGDRADHAPSARSRRCCA